MYLLELTTYHPSLEQRDRPSEPISLNPGEIREIRPSGSHSRIEMTSLREQGEDYVTIYDIWESYNEVITQLRKMG